MLECWTEGHVWRNLHLPLCYPKDKHALSQYHSRTHPSPSSPQSDSHSPTASALIVIENLCEPNTDPETGLSSDQDQPDSALGKPAGKQVSKLGYGK